MESKQNRALKEFDSLYKMIDDVYHEIALSMHLTDSAFLILYCLLELGDGCSQKEGISTYFLQSLDENFLKNISVLSLIWKMLHLNLWSLRSVNIFSLTRKYETICLRGKGVLVYHEDSIIRSFHLQTSDPFCISINNTVLRCTVLLMDYLFPILQEKQHLLRSI